MKQDNGKNKNKSGDAPYVLVTFVALIYFYYSVANGADSGSTLISAAIFWLAACVIVNLILSKKKSRSDDPEECDKASSEMPEKEPSVQKRTLKTETFLAAGVNYYTENIGKLATRNPDWKCTAAQIISNGKAGRKIYRYNYVNKPVKLVPEPENQHDKNAVAIFIAGELVGYISREENVHVKEILSKHEVKYISGFIRGGQYKVISENKDIVRMDEHIKISVKIGYV